MARGHKGSQSMDRRPAWRAVAGLLLLAAACVGSGPGEAASITFPGSNWTQVDPASVNVDPGTLNQAIAIGKSRHGQGMVTRWGNLVGSWGNIYTQYRLSSATKRAGSASSDRRAEWSFCLRAAGMAREQERR